MLFFFPVPVTFSRIDPGGKLVMGFRKSTNNNEDIQVEPYWHFHFILNPLTFRYHISFLMCGRIYMYFVHACCMNRTPRHLVFLMALLQGKLLYLVLLRLSLQ